MLSSLLTSLIFVWKIVLLLAGIIIGVGIIVFVVSMMVIWCLTLLPNRVWNKIDEKLSGDEDG